MVRKKIETADVKSVMETPENMKIIKQSNMDIVVKTNSVIVFKLREKLTEDNYALLSKWVRKENEASGLNIVIAPYSVDVQVGGKQ